MYSFGRIVSKELRFGKWMVRIALNKDGVENCSYFQEFLEEPTSEQLALAGAKKAEELNNPSEPEE